MPEDRTAHVLARITQTPELARVVPHLQPEVLHAVVTHCGLHDSGDLLALATPEQLTAVLDLDLWKADRAGGDEQFDATRFGEWLEMLVGIGAQAAAAKLAEMEISLVVAGLSANVAVFDAAVFSAAGDLSGADAVSNIARDRGVHAEIGGYIVMARRTESWDAIVDLLLALAEQHAATFHDVMQGCRRLSNTGWERDGLDDLLLDSEQARFNLSVGREQRRGQRGFVSPEEARAFLEAARHAPPVDDPPPVNPVSAAYSRPDEFPEITTDVVVVLDALHQGGILPDTPRTWLAGAENERPPNNPALNRYLKLSLKTADAWTSRNSELAFLSNALVAGCSVQGRSFTPREAMDAVAATCNLGLECWLPQWTPAANHDLRTIFHVGWSVIHRDVSMVAAELLLAALNQVRTTDRDLQLDIFALRRQLDKQRAAATPWRVRERLDVLASFDLPAWAALSALFDECPVMLANVSTPGARGVRSVNPSEFGFVANAAHVAAVRRFLTSLPERLTG